MGAPRNSADGAGRRRVRRQSVGRGRARPGPGLHAGPRHHAGRRHGASGSGADQLGACRRGVDGRPAPPGGEDPRRRPPSARRRSDVVEYRVVASSSAAHGLHDIAEELDASVIVVGSSSAAARAPALRRQHRGAAAGGQPVARGRRTGRHAQPRPRGAAANRRRLHRHPGRARRARPRRAARGTRRREPRRSTRCWPTKAEVVMPVIGMDAEHAFAATAQESFQRAARPRHRRHSTRGAGDRADPDRRRRPRPLRTRRGRRALLRFPRLRAGPAGPARRGVVAAGPAGAQPGHRGTAAVVQGICERVPRPSHPCPTGDTQRTHTPGRSAPMARRGPPRPCCIRDPQAPVIPVRYRRKGTSECAP